MSELRSQAAMALGCFRSVGSAPWALAYPFLLAACVVACTIAFPAYVLFGWPIGGNPSRLSRSLAVIGYFTVVPVVIAFWSVAFAYEIDAIYAGRSPSPGSGLRVALSKFPLVLAAALALGPGSFLLSKLQGVGPIGRIVDVSVFEVTGVLEVFLFPVIATTDGDPRAAFEELTDALAEGWGVAAVSSVSTRALLTVIGWSGIVTGVPMGFLAFWGVTIVSVPPWGPFTVPVLLPFASMWLAFVVTALVRGVLNTALYRYVRTGEYPQGIGTSPDRMLQTTASSHGQAAADASD